MHIINTKHKIHYILWQLNEYVEHFNSNKELPF
jgi:hypothetical protein